MKITSAPAESTVATHKMIAGEVYSLSNAPSTRYIATTCGPHGIVAVNLECGRWVHENVASSLRWIHRPNAELVDGPR